VKVNRFHDTSDTARLEALARMLCIYFVFEIGERNVFLRLSTFISDYFWISIEVVRCHGNTRTEKGFFK